MAHPPEKTKAPQPSAKERRERRLAEVLRANLKRRKAGQKGSNDAEKNRDIRDQDDQAPD